MTGVQIFTQPSLSVSFKKYDRPLLKITRKVPFWSDGNGLIVRETGRNLRFTHVRLELERSSRGSCAQVHQLADRCINVLICNVRHSGGVRREEGFLGQGRSQGLKSLGSDMEKNKNMACSVVQPAKHPSLFKTQ